MLCLCSCRGSPEHAEFWNFFQRYRQFQARRPRSRHEGGRERKEGPKSPRFGLPRDYDRSYRISVSVVTPDLAYRLRRVQERREDEGKEGQDFSVIYICYEGSVSNTSEPCPKGYFCPEGTPDPQPCPVGSYSPTLRLSDASQCILCPSGYFCEELALTEPSGVCDDGFHCPFS